MTLSYAGALRCQGYPHKAIRVVTTEPGGGNDIAARLVAQGISSGLGQPVIVDNRGGGGGLIAIELVARAPADGYSLLFYGSSTWLLPLLKTNVSYDPMKDFAPITLAVKSPNVIVVNPSVAATSVRDLIDLAKSRPGALNYATSGTGNANHIAGELFKAMAGIDIVRINYKGSAAALNDVIAGHVQIMFPTAGSVTPYFKAGKLRALAVASLQPSPLAPGLPTVSESGLPGYESGSILGMFAPSGTPATIINRLNQEIVRVLNRQDEKERLLNIGLEVVGSSPAQFAATVKADIAQVGKVIKNAGIRDE